LLFILCAVCSLLYGYSFLDVPESYRDWNEILRISCPLILMLGLLGSDKDFLIKAVVKFLYYGAFIVLAVAAVEKLFPSSLGYYIASLYNSGYQLESYSYTNAARIFITGADPNTGSAIVILFLDFNIICFLRKRKFRFLLMSILLFLALFLTGSRTGLVAFVLSFTVILLLTSVKYKRYNLLMFFLVLIMLVLIVPRIPYIRIGFSTLFNGTNNSVLIRIENAKEVITLFKQSMFFGWGPAKEIHSTVVDSEYFLLLRRYGLIGLLSIFMFMMYNLIKIFRNRTRLRSCDADGSYSLAVLVLGYTPSLFVVMLTNNFISSYQLLLPYMLITFLVHLKISQLRNNR